MCMFVCYTNNDTVIYNGTQTPGLIFWLAVSPLIIVCHFLFSFLLMIKEMCTYHIVGCEN
jgi:hypothetical protein